MSLSFGCCVICGNKKCLEAYDHIHTDIRSLERILQMGRVATKQTNELVSRVQNHYNKLTQSILKILKDDESNIVQSLRRL
jgi:phosphomevalonate kinase